MVRRVPLNQDKHASSVLRNLKEMTLDGEHCDFTVKVKCRELHTHKCVLSASSLYFKAMLKPDTMKESQDGKVEMKNVDFECVKSCIDFMYSGYFNIPEGKIGELLGVADMMQLDDIKEAICHILDEELNPENFYEYRNIAQFYELQNVLSKCKKYYKQNFVVITTQPGFENESESDIVSILKSNNLELSEEEKLRLLFRWIGEDAKKKEDAFELIKLVHLEKVSSHCLNDLLEECPIVSNDMRLYKLISSASNGVSKHVTPPEGATCGREGQELSNETIVIFDGKSDRLQFLDANTNEMRILHDASFQQFGRFSPAFIDPYIYVCIETTLHRLNYKNKTSTWERMSDMNFNHGFRPLSVSLSGSLYVLGDLYGNCEFKNVIERFYPAVNKWVRLLDKPGCSVAHALVTMGDSIYAIGGLVPRGEEMSQSKTTNKVYKFTPSSSQWFELEPMRKARYGCAAVGVGQRIFVFAGYHSLYSGEVLKEVEFYDVTSRQWTSLTPATRGLGNYAITSAHHIDGSIFVFRLCSGSIREVDKYEIETDRWTKITITNGDNYNVFSTLSISTSL